MPDNGCQLLRVQPRRRVWAAALFVTIACTPPSSPLTASSDSLAPPTSLPSATDLAPDEVLAEAVALVSGSEGEGGVLLAVFDAEGGIASHSVGSVNGVQPSLDDVYRVGSITKVFTSALVLVLVDDGVLELDDVVADHLPELAIHREITVRDLLQHTSRIPDFVASPEWGSAVVLDPRRVWTAESTLELVDLGVQTPALESGFAYSSTNHLLLGMIVEAVTGRSFGTVLRERILEPHGLSATFMEGMEEGSTPFAGYVGSGEFDWTSVATSVGAAGGIATSPEDLHRFFSALFQGAIISPDGLTSMVDPLVSMEQAGGYGLGIALLHESPNVYGHAGSIHGSDALVAHIPDSGMTVFGIATNHLWPIAPAVGSVLGHLVGDSVKIDTDLGSGVCSEELGVLRDDRGFVCPPRMITASGIRFGQPFGYATEAGYLAGRFTVEAFAPAFRFTRTEPFRAGGVDWGGFANLDITSSESCDRCRRSFDVLGDRLAPILGTVEWDGYGGFVADVRRTPVTLAGWDAEQIDVTIEEGACRAAWCTLPLADGAEWNWSAPQRIRIVQFETLPAALVISAHPEIFESYWEDVAAPLIESLHFDADPSKDS